MSPYPELLVKKKWTTKNQIRKSVHDTQILCSYRPERYLGPRDPLLEVCVMGGGSKPKVQGTDSYPVNEYIT